MITHAIPIYQDNYVWVMVHPLEQRCIVVDPGDAKPIQQWLLQHDIKIIDAILITHHHWDHTTGLAELLQDHQIPFYAPERIIQKYFNHSNPKYIMATPQSISIPGWPLRIEVEMTPGHTYDHVSYIVSDLDSFQIERRLNSDLRIFCGDTLFSGGCGRIFDGSGETLYHSLQLLASYPGDTEIYCGHEYTINNLNFALTIDPTHEPTLQRLQQVQGWRANNIKSLPTTIAIELATNPFLRCNEAQIANRVSELTHTTCEPGLETFIALRAWKDKH